MKKYSNRLIEESQKINNNIDSLKIVKGKNLDFDVFKINQDLSFLCNDNKSASLNDLLEIKKTLFM